MTFDPHQLPSFEHRPALYSQPAELTLRLDFGANPEAADAALEALGLGGEEKLRSGVGQAHVAAHGLRTHVRRTGNWLRFLIVPAEEWGEDLSHDDYAGAARLQRALRDAGLLGAVARAAPETRRRKEALVPSLPWTAPLSVWRVTERAGAGWTVERGYVALAPSFPPRAKGGASRAEITEATDVAWPEAGADADAEPGLGRLRAGDLSPDVKVVTERVSDGLFGAVVPRFSPARPPESWLARSASLRDRLAAAGLSLGADAESLVRNAWLLFGPDADDPVGRAASELALLALAPLGARPVYNGLDVIRWAIAAIERVGGRTRFDAVAIAMQLDADLAAGACALSRVASPELSSRAAGLRWVTAGWLGASAPVATILADEVFDAVVDLGLLSAAPPPWEEE